MSTDHLLQPQSKAQQFWRISKTINEMLHERGYEVPEKLIAQDFEEFKSVYFFKDNVLVNTEKDSQLENFDEKRLVNTYFPKGDSGFSQRLMVLFLREKSPNYKLIMSQVSDYKKNLNIDKNEAVDIIIVTKEEVTHATRKIIDTNQRNDFTIEVFLENELFVNITKHKLQPQFKKLSENEKDEICKKYRATSEQFPYIRKKDPVSRYFGLKEGDMIKITRPSETAAEYESYRVCVDD